MPESNHSRTKHGQVRAYILNLIETNKIKIGDSLPGEMELAEQLSVSRNTVRHAFSSLVQQGIVKRTRGRGTVYEGVQAASKTSKAVGIINSSMSHSIYPELLHGIEDGLYRGGYSMILANGNYSHEKELESLRRMLEQGIVGLVIEPHLSSTLGPQDEIIRQLNGLEIPIVTTNCVIPSLRGSAITVDDRETGRRATEYLVSLGHRRIACVYKTDAEAGVRRFEGYQDALRAAGLPFDETLTRPFDETLMPSSPGALLTGDILDSASAPPTAVFYFNDEIAVHAYDAIESRGLRIPDDVSVVAVDDIREASLLAPPLTTFHHPKYVMGKLAAELMIAQLTRSLNHAQYTVRMQLTLIERGSVAYLREKAAV